MTAAYQRRTARAPSLLTAVFLLAGCNGDGSQNVGGGSSVMPASPEVLSNFFVQSFDAFEDAARNLITANGRYTLQDTRWRAFNGGPVYETYPLQSAGIHYAHAAGLTGAGQTIVIVDGGLLTSHEVFAGKSITQAGPALATDAHGTLVASVAAGASSEMIGVAPGADLGFGDFANDAGRIAATRLAEELGAVALNNSWGFVETPLSRASYDAVFGHVSGAEYLQSLKSYARTGVVVFAASNDDSDATSDLMAALPALEPELEAGWLAVINAEAEMSGNNVVGATRISGACFQAAAWCLAAEGTWVGATNVSDTSYDFATGTSFAAPMVSGALALLGEAFPDMTPHDLRIRLLASADNTFSGFNASGQVELVEGFFHRISDEWGHGFLDVRAALLPIGPTAATLSDGAIYEVSGPLAVDGGATGDAVARAMQGVTMIVDDALQTQFTVDAGDLVASSATTPRSDLLLARWQRGDLDQSSGLSTLYADTQVAEVGSGQTRFAMTVPAVLEAAGHYGITVAQTRDTAFGLISAGLSLGQDDGALLPLWFNQSRTPFVAADLTIEANLGPQTLVQFEASFGQALETRGAAGQGAQFDAMKATLSNRNVLVSDDRFSVSVGLPVAVSGGTTLLKLPVARQNGLTRYEDVAVPLAPESREISLDLTYGYALSDQSDVVITLAHSENFGHRSGVTNTGLFLGFRTSF